MEEIQQRREILRIKRLEKTQNPDNRDTDGNQTSEKQDGCKSGFSEKLLLIGLVF